MRNIYTQKGNKLKSGNMKYELIVKSGFVTPTVVEESLAF